MQTLLPIKRGNTFALTADFTDANGNPSTILASNIKSQIRDASGRLITDLIITSTGTAGQFTIAAQSTANWLIEDLYMDIQQTSGGVVTSSETITIPVVKDVTQ